MGVITGFDYGGEKRNATCEWSGLSSSALLMRPGRAEARDTARNRAATKAGGRAGGWAEKKSQHSSS